VTLTRTRQTAMTPKADTYIVPPIQATKPTNGMHGWEFFYFDYFFKKIIEK
jgi:hypothetical protein